MDNMIYILFLCVFPPLLLSLFILDKRARLYVGYILIGFFLCFLVSGINSRFLALFKSDTLYVTTTVTPITEEIIKALPILFYAFVVDSRKDRLVSLAFLCGIGFAIMENMVLLINAGDSASLLWAALRGFASACLHGVCTAMVATGISFVRQKKKLFFAGTFSLLTVAITTHAVYNALVQSEYAPVGYAVPLLVYLFLILWQLYKKKEGVKPARDSKVETPADGQ